MKKISVLITKIALILFLISCSSPGNGFSKYQCPMKCEGEKTYEEPGKCPVCKMDLVKIKEAPFDSTMSTVKISGAMSNVMHKGELFGTIYLDTISDKTHLYGLGPEEYLSGELLIIDGKSYKSNVLTDTTMRVEETYNVKAPFFVYANVNKWQEQNLPDSVQTARQLETYIGEITKNSVPPFAFKLTGIV